MRLATNLTIERGELYRFCDDLPAPIVAVPVVTGRRGEGLHLHLRYRDTMVTLVERDGKPCRFRSVDEIIFELDGAPNVRAERLVVDTAGWWS
jgi:hypothetical protein